MKEKKPLDFAFPNFLESRLRASSHEPVSEISRPSPKSFVKFSMCSYEREGRGAGSVLEILVSVVKILPYEHFSPVTGMIAGWILAARMASSYVKNIPLQRYSFKACQSYGGRESFIVFLPCLLCFSNFASELVPRILSLFLSRKLGWNSSDEPKAKLVPGTGPARSTGLMLREALRSFLKHIAFKTEA